jgi:hypothetical protein
MPKQIKYAIITIVISVLLGCLDFMFQFLNITKQQAEINSTDIFVGILLTGILLFFIAKRHNGARWVFYHNHCAWVFVCYSNLSKGNRFRQNRSALNNNSGHSTCICNCSDASKNQLTSGSKTKIKRANNQQFQVWA